MSLSTLRDLGGGPVGELQDTLRARLAAGQRFAALLGRGDPASGTVLIALVAHGDRVTPLPATLPAGVTHYPALTPDIPAAFWYERAIHDLVGLVPDDHPRLDPLVLPHRGDAGPLPHPGTPEQPERIDPDERALSAHLHGTGVFTIPHGPVRSGVFESVEYLVETPGEDIPHLRIRPHYKHRGLQKRFEGLTVRTGYCSRNGSRASPLWRTRWPSRTPSSRWRRLRSRRPPGWCGCCTPSWSGSPTTSTSSAGSPMPPGWPWRPRGSGCTRNASCDWSARCAAAASGAAWWCRAG